jgi:hypothetical protein
MDNSICNPLSSFSNLKTAPIQDLLVEKTRYDNLFREAFDRSDFQSMSDAYKCSQFLSIEIMYRYIKSS